LLGWDHWGFVKWSEMPDDPEMTSLKPRAD
jgi:hypothetical protein